MNLSAFVSDGKYPEAYPAKEAKAAKVDPIFSSFSFFSRGAVTDSNSRDMLSSKAGTYWKTGEWRAFFDERAGIAEFDGGQIRSDAQALAFECCIVEWLNQHPEPSDPCSCAWCGKLDRSENTVLPFGTGVNGHTWLHIECWNDWRLERREKACKTLEGHGIKASVADDLRRISKSAKR